MTQDIDIVIDNEGISRHLDAILAALAESDFVFDEGSIRKAVVDHGRFQLLDNVESLKLDVYPRELIPGELGRSVLAEVFEDEELPIVSRVVAALKDPMFGNLDRIQIVKGWLGEGGKAQERVYDVVWGDADRREIGPDGRCRTPVGSTVDVEEATYRNSIGAAELSAFWRDPEFDASQRAFYYVRVLEIPTPRWTTYDARIYDREIPEGAPTEIQERAYTSPIWYTP